ncbi:hypothetical protein GCM10023347_33640 [Streptomyces chumphonensis]|uniref:Uncharacterized protein n=1 Tax=Streptomyces chumphonensis TaxID=1214925 RepID=A0A927ICE0_9ACTN|nr:hypothetical protein [Streptomyces chumphonensis]MBD3931967.1 hypothetical protein [Streptomyces chumphonensis]
MSITHTEQQTSQGERTALVSVRGKATEIACPSWCTVDHTAKGVAAIEDVFHTGECRSVLFTGHGGEQRGSLLAELWQAPFARDTAPKLTVSTDQDDDCHELDADATDQLAADLEAHAAWLRSQAAVLRGTRPALTGTGSCHAHRWCTATGDHQEHTSPMVKFPHPDGSSGVVVDAYLFAEDGGTGPVVAFCDADLTPAQTRAAVADMRAWLVKVEALADTLDGEAPA